MPSKKVVLSAAVDADLKKAFQAVAIAQTLTKSHLLAIIVTDYLQRAPAPPPVSSALDGVKTEEVHVRLSPFKRDELARLAASRHWRPGTYLRHLFDVHLSGEPRFADNEILALRQVAAQLAAMGRNINQIAHALNISLDNAHLAMAVEFEEMKMLLDLERTFVKDLIRANLQSWGVNDGH